MNFPRQPDQTDEFINSTLDFTAINLAVNKKATVHITSAYKYLRSIVSMSPVNAGQQQRRLYIDFRSRGDSNSPSRLLIYVLIYCVKNEYTALDSTIYDYEKATEITASETF